MADGDPAFYTIYKENPLRFVFVVFVGWRIDVHSYRQYVQLHGVQICDTTASQEDKEKQRERGREGGRERVRERGKESTLELYHRSVQSH